MKKNGCTFGALLVALLVGVPSGLVGDECDAKCVKGVDALTGEEADVCGKTEPGEKGGQFCYIELTPEEQDDGSIEWKRVCVVEQGACSNGNDWGYPIA